jgi:hypothetical protein
MRHMWSHRGLMALLVALFLDVLMICWHLLSLMVMSYLVAMELMTQGLIVAVQTPPSTVAIMTPALIMAIMIVMVVHPIGKPCVPPHCIMIGTLFSTTPTASLNMIVMTIDFSKKNSNIFAADKKKKKIDSRKEFFQIFFGSLVVSSINIDDYVLRLTSNPFVELFNQLAIDGH